MPVLPVSVMIFCFIHLTFLSLFLFISISMLFLEGHCCLPSGQRALVLILPHCALQRHTQRQTLTIFKRTTMISSLCSSNVVQPKVQNPCPEKFLKNLLSPCRRCIVLLSFSKVTSSGIFSRPTNPEYNRMLTVDRLLFCLEKYLGPCLERRP